MGRDQISDKREREREFNSASHMERKINRTYSFVFIDAAALNACKLNANYCLFISIYGQTILLTQRILINSNDFTILQDCFVLWTNGAQIDRHQEWSCKDCPQSLKVMRKV